MTECPAVGSVIEKPWQGETHSKIQQRFVLINRIAIGVFLTAVGVVACAALLPKAVVIGTAITAGMAAVALVISVRKTLNLVRVDQQPAPPPTIAPEPPPQILTPKEKAQKIFNNSQRIFAFPDWKDKTPQNQVEASEVAVELLTIANVKELILNHDLKMLDFLKDSLQRLDFSFRYHNSSQGPRIAIVDDAIVLRTEKASEEDLALAQKLRDRCQVPVEVRLRNVRGDTTRDFNLCRKKIEAAELKKSVDLDEAWDLAVSQRAELLFLAFEKQMTLTFSDFVFFTQSNLQADPPIETPIKAMYDLTLETAAQFLILLGRRGLFSTKLEVVSQINHQLFYLIYTRTHQQNFTESRKVFGMEMKGGYGLDSKRIPNAFGVEYELHADRAQCPITMLHKFQSFYFTASPVEDYKNLLQEVANALQQPIVCKQPRDRIPTLTIEPQDNTF